MNEESDVRRTEASDMSARLDKLLAAGREQIGEPISVRLTRIEETLHSIVNQLGNDSRAWSDKQLDRFGQIEHLMHEIFEEDNRLSTTTLPPP